MIPWIRPWAVGTAHSTCRLAQDHGSQQLPGSARVALAPQPRGFEQGRGADPAQLCGHRALCRDRILHRHAHRRFERELRPFRSGAQARSLDRARRPSRETSCRHIPGGVCLREGTAFCFVHFAIPLDCLAIRDEGIALVAHVVRRTPGGHVKRLTDIGQASELRPPPQRRRNRQRDQGIHHHQPDPPPPPRRSIARSGASPIVTTTGSRRIEFGFELIDRQIPTWQPARHLTL